MAPVRPKKRDLNTSSPPAGKNTATGSNPSTPTQNNPIKKRKMGISLHHKQALIDNLQLEITERARRLRAQYHLQAQGLRSRIEIRINRIPTALRKAKMGDLLLKYLDQEQKRSGTGRPPPVPAKDMPSRASPQKPAAAGRAQKRTSDVISGDKENEVEHMENPKKRVRGARAPDAAPVRPTQVLSPTSSNSRMNRDRPASPTKSQIARPTSPLKTAGTSRSAAATSVLSSMVEKAKATRAGGTRKVTTASNTSASSAGAAPAPASKARGGAASKAQAPRPGTRTARRASDHSETSEGSAATTARKTGASKATTQPATKKTVMGTIRKGVAAAGTKKPTTKPAAPPASTAGTGRVLRKRG